MIGQTVSHYNIIEKLSKGGMGEYPENLESPAKKITEAGLGAIPQSF